MSTEVNKRKKSPTSEKNKPQTQLGDGDHRKRRRNRTTQSCLNCHTSKRMCDRKRPACGRCTQLGLTGLCVYEVDDPNQRPDAQDESSRLLKRVAELEGVIRELKNKPHPRWAPLAGGEQVRDDGEISPAGGGSPSLSSPIPQVAQGKPPTPFLRSLSPPQLTGGAGGGLAPPSPLTSSSPATPISSGMPSPHIIINDDTCGLSYGMGSGLAPIFTSGHVPHMSGYEDSINKQFGDLKSPYVAQPCNCVLDASNYHTMLELSLRLRKAAGMLSQSPQHQGGSACLLNQRLSELDILTTNTLSSVDGFHALASTSRGVHGPCHPAQSQSSTLTTPLYPFADTASRLDHWLFDTITDADNDTFMSWEPPRRLA